MFFGLIIIKYQINVDEWKIIENNFTLEKEKFVAEFATSLCYLKINLRERKTRYICA